MEDILASIRRILNEDEATSEANEPDDGAKRDDMLVLDSTMMVSHTEASVAVPEPVFEPEPEAAAPVSHVAPPAVIEAATLRPQPAALMEAMPSPNLLAPEAAAAAASSVGNLLRTLTAGRATQVYSGGPTLEDLVRSELRPMLKEWLDVNLPPVVERLVRAEIERVVGRAVP